MLPNASLADAPIVFWGEWEPPSYVRHRWAKDGDLPQFLHDPVWERPNFGGFRQNTNPWVFGDCFRYSNCHQPNQSGLRTLPLGSVILFGSTLGLNSDAGPTFVLDTVFVVGGEPEPFSPATPPNTDESFRVCTVEALATGGDPNAEYMLYKGATHEDQVNGMYSFIPCRRADHDDVRFARPSLSLPVALLNPRNWRVPFGANRLLPSQENSVLVGNRSPASACGWLRYRGARFDTQGGAMMEVAPRLPPSA